MARTATARTSNLSGWLPAPISTGAFRFGARASAIARPTVPDSFGAWMATVRPEFRWDARHFIAMQSVLDRVTDGTLRRVYFQIPIRHGKSEHNTVGYAVYRLKRDPTTRILLCSYSDTKAQEFSREARKLAVAVGIDLSRERNAAGKWETVAGGYVKAVGAGAGVASTNADLILIDDPIGRRGDAESQATRDQVWDWITSDVLGRSIPNTAVVMTMSRWHTDDPAGRLLDQQRDRWTVLDLPGRAEANDPLGRPEGEPLWIEERGEQWHIEARSDLLEYGYTSLVQGRPRPREGGMFKWAWWQLLDAIPSVGQMLRYWDLAGTEPKGRGHDPDFSAGALGCRMADQRTAVVDLAHFRKSVAARDAELETVARADLSAYPGRVTWWIETESGIMGQERTAMLVRRLQALGMPVKTEHPTGSKVSRAEPLASACEAGNVLLCPGAWRDVLRAEAADFPNGNHDDAVDATSAMYNKLCAHQSVSSFRAVY